MRNFKLKIEYDGGRYDGWQRLGANESTNTIERKITDVLAKMTGEEIVLAVGLRTEQGVHAYGQTASFQCNTKHSCREILHYLNRYLPRDIAVIDVMEMPERFHASLNAKSRTYLYRIDVNEVPDVFERRYKYNAFKRLDVEKMKQACKLLCGVHDFRKFSSAKKNKSTVKEIYRAEVFDDGGEVQITVEANDFLHNMARLIFGTLLLVGNKELEPEEILKMLDAKSEVKPETMADTCGMFLQEIKYDK